MSLVALGMMHHGFGRHAIGLSHSTAWNGIGRHWLLLLGIHPLPPHPCRHFHAGWHAIGRQCMPPQCYGRLIHVAWHSAAVGIGSRHSPIAAPSMPPLPCCPIQWNAIRRQCMPPHAIDRQSKSHAALTHILAALNGTQQCIHQQH